MNISYEYNQYQKVMYIKKMLILTLCHPTFKKCHYEIKNILERFLISIANLNKNNTSSKIFSILNFEDTIVQKAYNEILDKKYFLKKNLSDIQIKDIVQKNIINEINDFLNDPPKNNIPETILKYNTTDNTITYLDVQVKVNQTVLEVLIKFKQKYVIQMIIRYSTMLLQGQQWGIPFEQYNYLYKKYNLRFEGFASPLNSRLMGKKDAHFCSLFYDTDKYFGSIGSFFKVDMINPVNNNTKYSSIVWLICPPYIDKILTYSAEKVLESIEIAKKNKIEMIIFFIMPGWDTSESYLMLHKSKNKKFEEKLKPHKYFYEYQGKHITAVFNSFAFVLESYDSKNDYTNIYGKMKF